MRCDAPKGAEEKNISCFRRFPRHKCLGYGKEILPSSGVYALDPENDEFVVECRPLGNINQFIPKENP